MIGLLGMLGFGVCVSPLVFVGSVGITSMLKKHGGIAVGFMLLSIPFYIVSCMSLFGAIKKNLLNDHNGVLKITDLFSDFQTFNMVCMAICIVCVAFFSWIHSRKATPEDDEIENG